MSAITAMTSEASEMRTDSIGIDCAPHSLVNQIFTFSAKGFLTVAAVVAVAGTSWYCKFRAFNFIQKFMSILFEAGGCVRTPLYPAGDARQFKETGGPHV